jgi:hypothetical protein
MPFASACGQVCPQQHNGNADHTGICRVIEGNKLAEDRIVHKHRTQAKASDNAAKPPEREHNLTYHPKGIEIVVFTTSTTNPNEGHYAG